MYDDLVSGALGSPGLVDAAFGSALLAVNPTSFWSALRVAFNSFFGDFLVPLVASFGSWIRSTPLVLAVVAIFFAGFIVAFFFRLFQSA